MRAPVSWIRDYVDLPGDVTAEQIAERLTALGLKLEALESAGGEIQGPLVVGRVLSFADEPQKNGKVIRWCRVDVGPEHNAAHGTGEPGPGVGIVCGASNFAEGDLVVVVLPGGVLPGGFEISARKTYGHVSSGMICSASELGLGEDHDGIMVLPADSAEAGQDAFGVLGLDEQVIEFEINPDRAYALSLRGIARDAALAFQAPFRDPAARELPSADDQGHRVVVDDPEGCPLFVARRVDGFDPTAPTPGWMTRRITQAGMRPISLAVDVTNYVMLEIGRPIHGYDADKVRGALGVRRARAGERLTTLDGAERTLSPEDLVVTDDSGLIGLGGVMGGETTEMSSATTSVLVEAAHWDPVSMFRTGRRHKITSEAGKRNERGVDPAVTEAAADRVVELLIAHGGGVAHPGVTVVGSVPTRPAITISADLPARVTGMEIPAATTVQHLRSVGCEVAEAGDELTVLAPSWRPDIDDPFDLVEEVARVVGYDRVPSVLPPAPPGRGLTREQRLRRRVGMTLAGAGFVEVVDYPFVGTAAFDALGLRPDDPRRTALRLANPLSAEQPFMTTTLLPPLFETAARNLGRGQSDLALFELATVTRPRGDTAAPILPVERRPTDEEWQALDDALPRQPLHLAVVLTGERDRSGWWGTGRSATWADAVETVRRIAQALYVDVEVRATSLAPWHPGRCAEVVSEGDVVGHAGELHPKVCAAYGLPSRSAAAEIDLAELLSRSRDAEAPAFSTFPVAKEDIALVVDTTVTAAELVRTLQEGAGDLLESARLFDVYTGAQVGAGRKSMAFALRFRAPDRTLTAEETTAVREAAVALAARRHGAVLRA